MAGALQHAAGLRLQRVDVAALHDVVRALGGIDRRADRVGAVGGADPGRDALARLDRHRERRLVRRLVLRGHQLEAELVAALGRQREADPATGMGPHEVDRVGGDELRRDDEVALVLAILVVDDDDHLAGRDVLQGLLDGGELRVGRGAHVRAPGSSFSMYLAKMSTSRFRGVPGAAAPRLVRSSVSGMSDTSKPSSSTLATVRDTPSTAIEPFSTT